MCLLNKKSEGARKQSPHHYIFAHVALRQVCFANPLGFFALMAYPYRQKFLDDLWRQIWENCDREGKDQLSMQDIKIETVTIDKYPAILVQMPTPCYPGEAYMICIILKVLLNNLKQEMDDVQVRYFTLEKGIDISGRDRIVSCVWDKEIHVNYGDGPEPTAPEFMDAIRKLI